MPRYPDLTKRPVNFKGWYKDNIGNIYFKQPYHPYATKGGYVLEHRLICEGVLGRFLKKDEHVHHVNEDKSDNRHSNLVICQGNGYHKLLHKRKKALEGCGHANWLICRYCNQYDAPENLIVRRRGAGGQRAWHRECCRIHSNERYRKKVQNV